ncbi:MAG: hypothetical protein J3R72DRAFT_197895 [Linnemannia gamsii]|nr:MAG: hypothetical protein J3R72DRAFT_197895 [Linnemannia gamsii]
MSLQRFTSLSRSVIRAYQTTAASAATSSSPRTATSITRTTTHFPRSPSQARYLSYTSLTLQSSSSSSSSNRPGMTPPSASRYPATRNNTTTNTNKDAKLDPDKIKGPGGLTMTQIGRLVQQSRARDLEHQQKSNTAGNSSSSTSSSTGTKRK